MGARAVGYRIESIQTGQFYETLIGRAPPRAMISRPHSRFTKTTRSMTGPDVTSAAWGTRSSAFPGRAAGRGLSHTRTLFRTTRETCGKAARSAWGTRVAGDIPGSAGAGRSGPTETRV